jgi:hypothetical protein
MITEGRDADVRFLCGIEYRLPLFDFYGYAVYSDSNQPLSFPERRHM